MTETQQVQTNLEPTWNQTGGALIVVGSTRTNKMTCRLCCRDRTDRSLQLRWVAIYITGFPRILDEHPSFVPLENNLIESTLVMADPVQRVLHITQSIEEILEKHLQRSKLKRLFSFNSDKQILKKCRDKLQHALEILRMEIATSADHSYERLTLLQEIEEGLRNSHIHGGSPPGPNEPVSQYQTIRQRITANDTRQYFVARCTNIYIQDNSLVIDGSSNNITMVTGGPHRSS